MRLFFLALSFVATTAYCTEREVDVQKFVQKEELEMHHKIENPEVKVFFAIQGEL